MKTGDRYKGVILLIRISIVIKIYYSTVKGQKRR